MSANLCKQGQKFQKIFDRMWDKYHDPMSCGGREKCV